MYSFAQRDDLKVVDEPYYAHYLKASGANHPGKEIALEQMETNPIRIHQDMKTLEEQHGIVFIKNMGHHLIDMDLDFFLDCTNVFLLRSPKQMIASIVKIIPNPIMRDIALKRQAEVARFLVERNVPVLSIDSNRILRNPTKGLTDLCTALHIPFDANMLTWDAGPIEEDGVWAPWWYENVHQSTGFSKSFSENPFPSFSQGLLDEALPHYEYLKQFAI